MARSKDGKLPFVATNAGVAEDLWLDRNPWVMGNLTKDQVRDLSAPGRYPDGDGLILKIGPSGGKSRILRVQVSGRRRDIGLGIAR